MLKRLSKVIALMAMMGTVPVSFADIRQDFLDERPLIVIFQNAISDGMAIDRVVMEAISIMPDRAGDIVTAAILLVPALPPSACHLDIPPEEADSVPGWRDTCEKGIVQAAVAVGADPSVVTAATAAGHFNLTPLPAGENSLELPPQLIIRDMRRPVSVQVPNGGTGGGGVASPS